MVVTKQKKRYNDCFLGTKQEKKKVDYFLEKRFSKSFSEQNNVNNSI